MDRVIKLGASAIIERDGKVLLGRRSKDDLSLPGLWCTPGGGVELGESINEAMIREVREEVGLTVERVHDTFISIQERIAVRHTVLVFKKVSACGVPVAGDGFDKVEWFSQGEIHSMLRVITSATLCALTKFFDR
jgi:8-oxo-dGTP diphosphatase